MTGGDRDLSATRLRYVGTEEGGVLGTGDGGVDGTEVGTDVGRPVGYSVM